MNRGWISHAPQATGLHSAAQRVSLPWIPHLTADESGACPHRLHSGLAEGSLCQVPSRSWADGTEPDQWGRAVLPGTTLCLSPPLSLGEPRQSERCHVHKSLVWAHTPRPGGDWEAAVDLWLYPVPMSQVSEGSH